MRLRVLTPIATVLDSAETAAVRAADASGSFGILPGHADFVTVLEIGVMSWRDGTGREGFVALRGGVLRVAGGREVTVATREAHVGDDLEQLERELLVEYARRDEEDAKMRTRAAQLHAAAIRRLQEVLEAGQRPVGLETAPGFGAGARAPRPEGSKR
ncbi:MAG: F0F1 ATP synthase subunit epsilon [Alphaproteobacteria bacterium]|nr:MAG: F0F1 ATP synthase subunit epsilon [Alphaproteobacteria bacterium]